MDEEIKHFGFPGPSARRVLACHVHRPDHPRDDVIDTDPWKLRGNSFIHYENEH